MVGGLMSRAHLCPSSTCAHDSAAMAVIFCTLRAFLITHMVRFPASLRLLESITMLLLAPSFTVSLVAGIQGITSFDQYDGFFCHTGGSQFDSVWWDHGQVKGNLAGHKGNSFGWDAIARMQKAKIADVDVVRNVDIGRGFCDELCSPMSPSSTLMQMMVCSRVWRRVGQHNDPAPIRERHTSRTPGVMTWGAITYDSWSEHSDIAVHTRYTQQEPLTRVEPGETECTAVTHERAASHPLHTCFDINCTTTLNPFGHTLVSELQSTSKRLKKKFFLPPSKHSISKYTHQIRTKLLKGPALNLPTDFPPIKNRIIAESPVRTYTQCDWNTARQFGALRLAAMGYLMCVAISSLSVPRFSASNAENIPSSRTSEQNSVITSRFRSTHDVSPVCVRSFTPAERGCLEDSAVHTRCTQQEPLTRVVPGETECSAATHERAARHPLDTCCEVNCTTIDRSRCLYRELQPRTLAKWCRWPATCWNTVRQSAPVSLLQWRVVNCCKVGRCLLSAVHNRRTQQDPITTAEPGETEYNFNHSQRAGKGPIIHILWRHRPSYISMAEGNGGDRSQFRRKGLDRRARSEEGSGTRARVKAARCAGMLPPPTRPPGGRCTRRHANRGSCLTTWGAAPAPAAARNNKPLLL
ncbi:hypothetical protein PR048_030088 [Dryococelus australis]|uniref:Uncharacterized protein n=1 Tax=Dryococelus australis TaxID=614101 RepID=A0ABQ9G7Y4_9NEOP|nr:hypothetical protein PR048_030088 [Dryococelus australis]